MTGKRVTQEEATWLYRVLFGRSPDDDSIADFLSGFGDFEGARLALMGSEEFRGRYASALRTQGVAPTAPIDSVCHRLTRAFSEPHFATHGFQQTSFGSDDTAMILESYAARTKPRVIVVRGSTAAKDLAVQLGGRALDETLILDCVDPDTPGGDGPLRGQNFFPEASTRFLTVESEFGPFARRLKIEQVPIDIFITDRDDLDEADLRRVRDQVTNDGAMILMSDRERLGGLAAEWLDDVIETSRVSFVARYCWPVPVRIPDQPPTSPRNKDRLAVAVIMKDEAQHIAEFIDRAAPICSHMVLVDTGSTDDTVKRAQAALKAARLPHTIAKEPFIDFSRARNAAIGRVPVEFDWILMLDVDEHIAPEDYAKLGELLDGNVEAYRLPRYNYSDLARSKEPFQYPDRQGRLFRNKQTAPIRFRGAVHEGLIGVQRWALPPGNLTALGRDAGGPHIHHFGYADISPERFAAKDALYRELAGR